MVFKVSRKLMKDIWIPPEVPLFRLFRPFRALGVMDFRCVGVLKSILAQSEGTARQSTQKRSKHTFTNMHTHTHTHIHMQEKDWKTRCQTDNDNGMHA